jgi:hypothetical protein
MASRPGRKRKVNVERFPGGDIKPQEEVSPAVAKRMMLAASARFADETWGTVIGRYLLTGQITQVQYEAGRKFGALVESYDRIMLGPKPPGQSIGEKIRGAEIDPNSEAGEAEVERHKQVLEAFDKARIVIGSHVVFEHTRSVCKGVGEIPHSYEVFLMVRAGLGSLAVAWRIDGKRKV